MLELKQSIVVEGKGDAANIARVCRANFILTSGLHIARETYREIELAIEKTGIILFTDPDSAGREIREKILQRFSDRSERILHANISAKEGRKKGDLGVENASPEAILSALQALRPVPEFEAAGFTYSMEKMCALGLAGSEQAMHRREALCDALRIGYCNAKQLAKKLSAYGISEEKVAEVLTDVQ